VTRPPEFVAGLLHFARFAIIRFPTSIDRAGAGLLLFSVPCNCLSMLDTFFDPLVVLPLPHHYTDALSVVVSPPPKKPLKMTPLRSKNGLWTAFPLPNLISFLSIFKLDFPRGGPFDWSNHKFAVPSPLLAFFRIDHLSR